MSDDIFRQGGPHQIRKTGLHEHTLSISIPTDRDGRVARECPDATCCPGEFKVTPGTGITEEQEVVYCPYCRGEHEPSDYTTRAQIQYIEDIAMSEAHEGIHKMIGKSLGLDSRGRRNFGDGGSFDISMEMKPSRKPHVRKPYSESLRRDLICPNCSLDHSVYGLATWCSDCGVDIFTTHVLGEIQVVRAILSDVPRREENLGARVATSDMENVLEDLVSIFEASLKYEVRRYAQDQQEAQEETERRFKKIGSKLQSVRLAQEILPKHCGIGFEHFATDKLEALDMLFQKRHPITHNLGVIDRKYLDRIKGYEKEGKEIRVSLVELHEASQVVFDLLESYHLQLHPGAHKARQRDEGTDQKDIEE
jgi:hypothetical protein